MRRRLLPLLLVVGLFTQGALAETAGGLSMPPVKPMAPTQFGQSAFAAMPDAALSKDEPVQSVQPAIAALPDAVSPKDTPPRPPRVVLPKDTPPKLQGVVLSDEVLAELRAAAVAEEAAAQTMQPAIAALPDEFPSKDEPVQSELLALAVMPSAGLATVARAELPIPSVKPAAPARSAQSVPTVQSAQPAQPVQSDEPVLAALPGAVVPKDAPAGSRSVQFEAIIAQGGDVIADKLVWTVTDEKGKPVVSETSARPKFVLLPGKYKVAAELTVGEVTNDLVVGNVHGKQVMTLNAAYLTVKVIPHAGAPAIKDDVEWELYAYAKGKTENGKKLLSETAPTQSYLLPAGAYVVRAKYDGAWADVVVPLEPGQGYNYTINLYAGTLTASATKAGGGKLTGEVRWEVLRANPGPDGSRETVAWFIGAKAKFTLREGSYVVIARASNMSRTETIEVKAGKVKKLTLAMKPGVDEAPAGKAPAASTSG